MKLLQLIALFIITGLHLLSNASENPNWINYTHQNVVFDIVHDDSIIWIATVGGLVKFNKNSEKITNYTQASHNLPGNKITSIALDSQKRLWLNTTNGGRGSFFEEIFTPLPALDVGPHYQGVIEVHNNTIWFGDLFWLSKYDSSSWTTYQIPSSLLQASAIVRDLKFDSFNNLWIGSRWGLGKFLNGEIIKQAGIDDIVNAIAIDKNNNLWLGTEENGLIKFKNKVITQYNTENSQIPTNSIRCLDFDSKNNLWIGTEGGGMAKFDGDSFYVFNIENSNLPENTVMSVSVDSEDNVWLGLFRKGLVKYANDSISSYNLSNSGLPTNFVTGVVIDTNNHIWLNCFENKDKDYIVKFNGKKWEYLDPITDLTNNYNQITYKNDINIVYNNEMILLSYSNKPDKWQIHSLNQSNRSSAAKMDKNGHLWIRGADGLLKYDGSNWQVFNSSNSPLLPENSFLINDIVFDSKNHLYVSTLPITDDTSNLCGKLIKYDGINWDTVFISEVKQFVSQMIFDSQDNLWIGTAQRNLKSGGDGLKKYDGSAWTHYRHTNSQFPNDAITNLCFDKDNNLWISTNISGLIKFDCNNSWTFYNSQNSGLPYNQVENLEIDNNNNKWMSVFSNGLSVFNENGIIPTSITKKKNNVISEIKLFQNSPNPFNPKTEIRYSLNKDSRVTVQIYNVKGEKITTLVNNVKMNSGIHTVTWNGINKNSFQVPSGIYFCHLQINSIMQTKKMILLK